MKKSAMLVTIFGVVFALVFLFFLVAQYPKGKKETPPSGYTFLRDDMLAAACEPVFDCPQEFGPILAVYYRAARDKSGVTYIAYHPVWAREWNETKAFGPFLSRFLYTGGLSLQRVMYGIGDIESVGLSIDTASGKPIGVDYETAAEYDPSSFSVKHLKVSKKGPFSLPLHFRVVSWNHLFTLDEEARASPGKPDPRIPLSYFTPELWAKYAMWKNPETLLYKNRAHFIWERGDSR